MRKITDDDLTLLYYGEHDDPTLAARVAASEELSARFEALGEELARMEALAPPERGDDYGAEVWRRISPRLGGEPRPAGFSSWWASPRAPRFSLAGALTLAVVFAVAFFLGREGAQYDSPPAETGTAATMALGELDPGQLLTASVSGHLEQLNVTFTQFANASEMSNGMAEHATDLLVANRLFRQAAQARGDRKMAGFLGDLEPLLIEMAHEAYKNSPATQDRMQQEVRDTLLFRIRVLNQQLKDSQIST
jgi:hypothetical protein